MAVPFENQGKFLIELSKVSGIDPRVILAWMFQEGAFKSGAQKGKNNFLNIMGSGGPVSYNSPEEAVSGTIQVLRQSNMNIILSTAQAKPTPKEEIAAIAASQWNNTSAPGEPAHYGGQGGPILQHTYNTIFGSGEPIGSSYKGPSEASKIVEHYLHLSPGGNVGGLGSAGNISPVDTAKQIWDSWAHFLEWIQNNWDRILWVIGGGILLVLGLYAMVRQEQSNVFSFAKGGE